jgi:hypothetical protein
VTVIGAGGKSGPNLFGARIDGTGTGGNGGIGGRTFTGVPIGSTITYRVGGISQRVDAAGGGFYNVADYSFVTVNGITIYASAGGGGAWLSSVYPLYDYGGPGSDGLGVAGVPGGAGGASAVGQHAGQPGTTNSPGGTNPGNAYGRGGVDFTLPTAGYVSITM